MLPLPDCARIGLSALCLQSRDFDDFLQSIEMKNTEIEETLYDRIGGQKGLEHLLTHFYADVRQHAVIGPIFEAQIQDWPMHIKKIAGFCCNSWIAIDGSI